MPSQDHDDASIPLISSTHPERQSSPDPQMDIDEDPDLAMQQMMGFSNFNTTQRAPRKKGKGSVNGRSDQFGTGANSQPVKQRQPRSSTDPATMTPTAIPFVPASLPPRPSFVQSQPQPQTKIPSAISQHQSESQESITVTTASAPNHAHNSRTSYRNPSFNPSAHAARSDGPAYTHPVTGVSFTATELQVYAKGKKEWRKNHQGEQEEVTVFFRPEFIADDIWVDLKRT